jgi:hypothetical protein
MEFEEHRNESGTLQSITCRIWRKDRNRPIAVTEHLSECKRNSEPWKMEHRMLRHKALMQCARYAFGFSGVTDEDEAQATPGLRDVTPQPEPVEILADAPAPKRKQAKESATVEAVVTPEPVPASDDADIFG